MYCVKKIATGMLEVLKRPESDTIDVAELFEEMSETYELNSHILFRMSPSNAKLLADAIKECDINKQAINMDKVDMIDNVVDMVNIIDNFRK